MKLPNLRVNTALRSLSSGTSGTHAAAYIKEETASLHSSGHSLKGNQKHKLVNIESFWSEKIRLKI